MTPRPRPLSSTPHEIATEVSRGRLLGIDLGGRRVGLAVADPQTGTIRPLATIRRADDEHDAQVLESVVREQGVGELVVGLPLRMDGTEGPQALSTRVWAERIASQLGLPISMRDERLTSVTAESRLGRPRRGPAGGPPSGRARHAYRARIDREAAVAILQAELDDRAAVRA
ncbi:MAG: Holliday junction resolvase RuvX [Chloroflexi bacterium]|nr:Holliday junction resolvase RuvX [Chloroflexota bacterium]